MPVIQLSAQVCQAAACIEGRAKTDFYDTAITGFILTVSASGSKVFSLRYRDQYGKQRQHKIGAACRREVQKLIRGRGRNLQVRSMSAATSLKPPSTL